MYDLRKKSFGGIFDLSSDKFGLEDSRYVSTPYTYLFTLHILRCEILVDNMKSEEEGLRVCAAEM
jgi:hypothetical protein